MSHTFQTFAKMVASSFQDLAKTDGVFVVDIEPDALWALYLASFPPGTDPLFKKRTEHDCSCCRQFVRRAGGVVAVLDGVLRTVWDDAAERAPHPYNVVASCLRDAVLAAAIANIYRVGKGEATFGAEKTRSFDPETQRVITWGHFYTGDVPKDLRAASPDADRGQYRDTVAVFRRGLEELSPSAVATVRELIEANNLNLYRGEEYKPAVLQFQVAQRAFAACESERARNVFAWTEARGPAARFRNTVIGTLVQDLSEGMDVERAVKAFETKVAPQNYKRPSAIITPGMVKKAMETIAELGLEPALERRFAVIGDVSVRDVLWVDGAAKSLMKGGIGDALMQHAVAANSKGAKADEERAEEISLDDFTRRVLPEATGLEIFFKGAHLGNLVALTAPVHPEPRQLFRWGNDFAWSYAGNVADSYLRKEVQRLGGRVDGVLRFSHMWNHEERNASLMDLHVFMPGSSEHRDGCHDTYPAGQRVGWNMRMDLFSGGVQDVDYVNPAPEGYVPVENTTFPSFGRLKDGKYTFKIHNWQLREPTQGGFRAEIEFGGQVFQYDHPKPLRHKEWITLAVATLKNGAFTIEHRHPVGTSGREKWGLATEQYAKVSAVTFSPNYWGDSAVGNRHALFFLDGCACDEPMRGIYNEFLHPRLEPHRKVFEVIGEKTKCQPAPGGGAQLAGLGFSSTKKDNVLARVQQGKRRRLLNVRFGG